MPTLSDALRGRDLSFLKMVANAWNLELNAPDFATALPQVVEGILKHPWREDVLEALPREAQSALQALVDAEGRLSWGIFTRRYGDVRPFGPGSRDKVRPDLNPVSPAEVLWYRALIGRAILPGDTPPKEYAYIPEDLLELLQPFGQGEDSPPGRPASPVECAHPLPAHDRVLDHAATLLAALRSALPLERLNCAHWEMTPDLLLELLKAARLVDDANLPLAEPVRGFLESSRSAALAFLAQEWMEALYLNELRLLPGLQCDGDCLNDALRTRQAVITWVSRVPKDTWWSLASFVKAVRERDPDFQRPAGDYDSWFIRSTASGEFLRGFESWDEVDGALLRFILTGPLHWLGFVDLACPAPGQEPGAFRFSPWAEDLLHGAKPKGLPEETGKPRLNSAGLLSVPRLAPRSLRYLLARFCVWEEETPEEYHYRIAPPGLERAAAQGLRPRQLLSLLRRAMDAATIPPSLVQALERWEGAGTQATLQRGVLLRVASPLVLEALKKTRAARYILEELSPTAALIHAGKEEKILEALAEIGYLGDIFPDSRA
ncbi:MAG: hypothetical protein HY835_06285 [Anaerolineae bacterium]|nr:hypothetical protein [Anaerolineae bacterium]